MYAAHLRASHDRTATREPAREVLVFEPAIQHEAFVETQVAHRTQTGRHIAAIQRNARRQRMRRTRRIFRIGYDAPRVIPCQRAAFRAILHGFPRHAEHAWIGLEHPYALLDPVAAWSVIVVEEHNDIDITRKRVERAISLRRQTG